MHIGNLSAAAGRLQEALEALQIAWGNVSNEWHDERSRKLEEDYLRPLAQEVNTALPAIGIMAQTLGQASRELDE